MARVGSAGRRRVLASRYAALAVLWPLFSVLVLAALILLCWITAVAGGKCDREQGGHVETAYVTEISLTTETPPQSYVWTLGVAVTWICFLCPATWLLHEAFLWTLRRHWAEALVLALSELLLVVAMLFLVGLAAVTNRGTFLEPSFELEDGHAIHQRMADLFFMCFYIHGGVFLVLQGIHWKELIWLERRSLVIKALLMVFMSLSVAGVLPSLFLELPALSPTEEIRELNRRGLTQRLAVLGIMLYVGTYSLELAALRKRLKEEGKSQASIFYGADEYLEELKKKYARDHEIAALKNLLPGERDHYAAGVGRSHDKMLKVEKNNENRSLKTNRLFPTANKPDPMPQNLAFLFTRITPEQMMYMWNVLTAIFVFQVLLVVLYCGLLALFPGHWWTCTLIFGIPFAYTAIQQIYIDHDVMHGATFPVYEFQKFLTHPFADFFSLPWEDFVLEHNRHHASTVDLLIQGEFGWDPEEFQYALQQWAGPMGPNWYKYLLTVPWIPIVHFFGLNDTGALFALEWWMHFPDEAIGGKCNKEFWSKWAPRRVKHNLFVLGLWACVWLLGSWPLGRDLSQGWRFVFTVSFFARVGFSAAWMFITNFTHSLPWNEFLAQDPARTWPVLHGVMALVLGGKHRWNEMLFHDVHHAFPNAVGTLSQRGRFHGWQKVHDAAAEVLARGLWMPNGDEETQMQKMARKRSLIMKQGK